MNISLDLPTGEWRYFTDKELAELNRLVSTSTKTYVNTADKK
jgi:23S rRNA pseudouridine2604 synthase